MLVTVSGQVGPRDELAAVPGAPVAMTRLGKHAAGRRLDGRFWSQMPITRRSA